MSYKPFGSLWNQAKHLFCENRVYLDSYENSVIPWRADLRYYLNLDEQEDTCDNHCSVCPSVGLKVGQTNTYVMFKYESYWATPDCSSSTRGQSSVKYENRISFI